MDAGEGRIRELQRLAYGADASDAERARAVDELARLATRGVGGDGPRDVDRADPGRRPETVDASDAATDTESVEPAQHLHATGRRSIVRWSAVAGTIGLLVGSALGWGIGRHASIDAPGRATSAASESAPAGTPLEETGLLDVFDRVPPAAESARFADVVDPIDPASVRLLATRLDGPAAYLARTTDGQDVCLVLLLPSRAPRSECTVGGRLPPDGLTILYGALGYGLAAARLGPTGVVSLGQTVEF
ncbi:hypothetical protein [Agromyces sp. Marseille-P2726]|uniref:hypothetical protein n=1 Tax=Agromyces sp. Marseille-P2726 TaxID=2709132 RepID=UPI00156FF4E4|nr:hypothetical protein [Agromyces sp. Marseille-P2726]